MSDVIDLSLNSVTSVDGGYGHSAAISSGCLYTWGLNDEYQCGNGTNIDVATPTKISNDEDWVEVACGSYHTLARKANGLVFAWGRNIEDQCGVYHNITDIGQSGNLHRPAMCSGTTGTPTVGYMSGVVQIAAAANYSMALQNDQKVQTVGQSSNYQIGSLNRSSWTILAGFQGSNKIFAGPNTSASITNGLGVKVQGVHGANSYYEEASHATRYTVYRLNGLNVVETHGSVTDYIDVAIGNNFLLAVTDTNELHGFTFGRPDEAQRLAIYPHPDNAAYTPFPPPEAITPIGFSGVDFYESNAGTVNHHITLKSSFMELFDNTRNYLRVAAGGRHAIMTTVEGEVYSFGNNNFYQLGRVFDGNDHNILEMTGSAGTGSWSVIGCGNNHSLICKE